MAMQRIMPLAERFFFLLSEVIKVYELNFFSKAFTSMINPKKIHCVIQSLKKQKSTYLLHAVCELSDEYFQSVHSCIWY